MRATPVLLVTCACSSALGQWVAIDLNPPGGWSRSAIYAVTQTRQFGEAMSPEPNAAFHPIGWNGSAASWFTLGEGAGTGGTIWGADATCQVGSYTGGRATLWVGSSQSRVDLHPAGVWRSEALAVSGSYQAGRIYSTPSSYQSAALWNGSSASYTNLNPPGAIASEVHAVLGSQQAGGASWGQGGRALIWNGSASNFENLHPGSPWDGSIIFAIAPGEQVGSVASFPNWPHAAIWHGTAQSFVDVTPAQAFGYAELYATCGVAQAGYIAPASGVYAGVWFGTAQSFHNLHQYLAPGTSESYATSIATDGAFIYVGGYAYYPGNGGNRAILWIGTVPGACYPNCDQSTTTPALNVSDFTCFLQRFASGEPYANCDRSTTPPTLNIADFTCFLQRFAAGCP